jgi:hypothetical protein
MHVSILSHDVIMIVSDVILRMVRVVPSTSFRMMIPMISDDEIA